MNRRHSKRYPVNQPVRYAATPVGGDPVRGVGHCVDFSGTGIRFEADRPVPVGSTIEVWVHWPAALDQTTPLQVQATGTVVRTAGSLVAVEIKTHEFRTAKTAPRAGAA